MTALMLQMDIISGVLFYFIGGNGYLSFWVPAAGCHTVRLAVFHTDDVRPVECQVRNAVSLDGHHEHDARVSGVEFEPVVLVGIVIFIAIAEVSCGNAVVLNHLCHLICLVVRLLVYGGAVSCEDILQRVAAVS